MKKEFKQGDRVWHGLESVDNDEVIILHGTLDIRYTKTGTKQYYFVYQNYDFYVNEKHLHHTKRQCIDAEIKLCEIAITESEQEIENCHNDINKYREQIKKLSKELHKSLE